MLSNSQIWGSLAGLGMLLGMASGSKAVTAAHTSVHTNQFRQIEQNDGVKIGVTVGGIALIGLELWWFIIY